MNEENRKRLEDELKSYRQEKCEPLTLEVLAKMLKDDVRFFDTHYIKSRCMEIFEKTVKTMDFRNKVIEDARKAFLDVLIDGLNQHLVNWESEKKELKVKLKTKDKEQRAKVVEDLKRIERFEQKVPRGKTEQRDFECEGVCQFIVKSLIKPEFFLKTDKFIKKTIEYDNELLVAYNVLNDLEELFNQIYNSVDESYLRANEIKWGKPRHEIKLKDIDKTLKQ